MSNGNYPVRAKSYGAIFTVTNKTSENMPDVRGTFQVSGEMLKSIVDGPKNSDGEVTLDLAGWTKQGPKSGKYLSASLQVGEPKAAYGSKSKTEEKPKEQDDQSFPSIPF